MTVPYLPSLEVCRQWMELRLEGFEDAEAWERIVASTPQRERRKMARSMVAGAHGQSPLTLSVPIAGGGSVLKRGEVKNWRVSMHGRWQDVHFGALEVAYSHTPYYPYLSQDLESVIKGSYENMPFTELTTRLHGIIIGILDTEEVLKELRRGQALSSERFRQLIVEKSDGLHTDLSILDVIFKKGPEGVFALL